MNLNEFRRIVDRGEPGIASCNGDLSLIYQYVGLGNNSVYQLQAISEKLYSKIRNSFSSGHSAVWHLCKSLRIDLINEHVFSGLPLDPYFQVLDRLQDAIRTAGGDSRELIAGDWENAIRTAFDHVQIQSWGVENRERTHVRDFMVARAGKFLTENGFPVRFDPGRLSLEREAEEALIFRIEDLVANIGGINVARRIFKEISELYDSDQQRYHVIRQVSATGGGEPQIPWGYLFQLAAKHVNGRKPYRNTDDNWTYLCTLSLTYGAVINVQPYTLNFSGVINATALIPSLQEVVLYDTLFRFPQMRPKDIGKIARGIFDWLDTTVPLGSGWSIDQVLAVVDYLLGSSSEIRGPILFEESDIRRACPTISSEILTHILNDVLSHPILGTNQYFSKPTDPSHDFFLRPLIRLSNRKFVLLDRSVCAPAFLEALLSTLRQNIQGFDDRLGPAIERFVFSELDHHGIQISQGNYDIGGEQGECDLVMETPDVVFFAEMKKKPLTRLAKAGSDVHLLLDLAGSLLFAQAQAGWHEVRLRQNGYLDLHKGERITRVNLDGREIERIAISLFDYGGFQDRFFLKQFLEASMNLTFRPANETFGKKFDEINNALTEIREQIAKFFIGDEEVVQPFFNCWFISVPQLLVLLDGVTGGANFKTSLWSCRHVITGSSDFYSDLSRMRH